MSPKKSVKKVEITDESVVNLKHHRERDKSAIGFHIHRIEDAPVDLNVKTASEIPAATAEALMDREPRSTKFDPEELHQRMESFAEKLEKAVIKVAPSENSSHSEPKEFIKVKFEKFVHLVASKDFLAVLERNKDEDIVMSSNLLTDLASAVEERGEKKSPVIFLVGLAIGVIITYLLINR